MLILSRYLKAVILTTYLCSLSHLVESRHMFDSDDQILEPRLDTRLSLPSVTDRIQRLSSPQTNSSLHSFHKHRHKHHLNYVNNNKFNNSINNENSLKQSQKISNNDRISTSREFHLYNRCSHYYISAFDKSINARALEDNQFSLMSLETLRSNSLGIRIRSVNAGVYLCFNKRGKLITRYIANNIGCLFSEETTEARYIKFRSLYNPDWYIGFNKNGRPMNGKIRTELLPHQQLKREKCFHFVKKSPQNTSPQTLDSSHEIFHEFDRDVKPIEVKTGNTRDVINSKNSFQSKPNDKLSVRLMSSSPKRHMNIKNIFSTNSSMDSTNISHNRNVKHRLNGRAKLTALTNE